MKKFIFALCFLALSGPLYGANTGWNPKPDGVHAKSPIIPIFLNQTAIDALTPTVGSLVHNTTTGENQWYDGAVWLNDAYIGSDASFKNLSVTGNLNVSGDGPHNISVVLDNATGDETAISMSVIINKATSGDATGLNVDCIDTSSPGALDCFRVQTGGVDKFTVSSAGNLAAAGNINTTGGNVSPSGNFITLDLNSRSYNSASNPEATRIDSSYSGASGDALALSENTTYNQSGTSGSTDFTITRNEIAIGSGEQNYIKATGGANDFRVDRESSIFAGGGVTFSGQTTIFGNYSSKFTENTIFANTSTATITVTLPDASLNPEGFFQTISKTGPNDNFNSVTLQTYTSTQTINRNATRLIEFPGNTVTVKTERGNWRVVQATPNTLSFTPSSLSTGSATGDFWTGGGFYHFNATAASLNQGSTTVTHGSANEFSGAHAGIVAGGPGSTDAGTVGIRAKGTSIADDGTRTPDDLEVIVADVTTMALNDYFESSKKWNGVVTFELFSSGGAATYSAAFDYGHAAYEDFEDNDILLRVFEMDGRAGGNDSDFRVRVYHHEGDGATGWTYAASGFDPGNGTIIDSNDVAPENDLASGEEFKWDRHELNTLVRGTQGQGMLIRVTTGAANAVRYGNFRYGHIILSK